MSRFQTLRANFLLILETEEYELVLMGLAHAGIVSGPIEFLRGLRLLSVVHVQVTAGLLRLEHLVLLPAAIVLIHFYYFQII